MPILNETQYEDKKVLLMNITTFVSSCWLFFSLLMSNDATFWGVSLHVRTMLALRNMQEGGTRHWRIRRRRLKGEGERGTKKIITYSFPGLLYIAHSIFNSSCRFIISFNICFLNFRPFFFSFFSFPLHIFSFIYFSFSA